METVNVTTTAETQKSKRPSTTHKDVQNAFHEGGVEEVRRLYAENLVSAVVISRAANELASRNVEGVSALNELVSEIAPKHAGRRGKQAPTVGETRGYKAQAVKNSGPFMRLPLDTLGIGKGDKVNVKFDNDQIVVTRG